MYMNARERFCEIDLSFHLYRHSGNQIHIVRLVQQVFYPLSFSLALDYKVVDVSSDHRGLVHLRIW